MRKEIRKVFKSTCIFDNWIPWKLHKTVKALRPQYVA